MKIEDTLSSHSGDDGISDLDQFDEQEDLLADEDCDTSAIYCKMDVQRAISPIQWDKESEAEDIDSHKALKVEAEPVSENNHRIPKTNRIESTYNNVQTIRRDEGNRNVVPSGPRLPPKMNQLFRNARYYLIKSNNFDNVKLAMERSAWATPRSNESRLNEAFSKASSVFLIFSVKESGRFQGYARIASHADPRFQISWVLPPRMNQSLLSGAFRLDWISRSEVSFLKTGHLLNSWNENKPVKIGRDGQEIEPSCGEKLCRLFPLDSQCKIDILIEKSRMVKKRTVAPPALLGPPPPVQPLLPHHHHHQPPQRFPPPPRHHLLQAPPPPTGGIYHHHQPPMTSVSGGHPPPPHPPHLMQHPSVPSAAAGIYGPPPTHTTHGQPPMPPSLLQQPPLGPTGGGGYVQPPPPSAGVPPSSLLESGRSRWLQVESSLNPRQNVYSKPEPLIPNRSHDHERISQRSRSPGLQGIDPDLLMRGNYQDYLRFQAAHGSTQRETQIQPLLGDGFHSKRSPPTRDIHLSGEKQYEDRVNDFLRGLDSRDRGGGVRTIGANSAGGHRRSRSRSPPRTKKIESSSSRHSKTRHRRSSYSRSRSRERR